MIMLYDLFVFFCALNFSIGVLDYDGCIIVLIICTSVSQQKTMFPAAAVQHRSPRRAWISDSRPPRALRQNYPKKKNYLRITSGTRTK